MVNYDYKLGSNTDSEYHVSNTKLCFIFASWKSQILIVCIQLLNYLPLYNFIWHPNLWGETS